MSTPRSLSLTDGIQPSTISTPRGEFAALIAEPENSALATVVLVPGFTGSKEDFLEVLLPIAKAGFRAVAYDQRGQYHSATAAEGEQVTLELLAADLLAVITEVSDDGRAHVVGHSFGGLVTQTAAVNHGQVVASLVLMCTGPGALPSGSHEMLNSLVQAVSAGVGLDQIWLVKDQLDRADGSAPPPPEVHEFLRIRFITNNPQALADKAHILATAPDRTDDLAQALSLHDITALVLYGENDDAWDIADQDQMAVRLGADQVVIDGAAHSPAVENVEATVEALVTFWHTAEEKV